MPPNRTARARDWLANVGLLAASLTVFALTFEFVVFRFLLLPADVPRNAWIDDLVRFEPHQTGVYRVGNEIAARYTVNAQGWNSGVGDYTRRRTDGNVRIAVIGDSFVHALQVDARESLAERLGDRIGAEVYRFGISGAPLSQYLDMLEKEVLDYSPDIVVIVLVHNDFDESFLFRPGRYTSSFLKLDVQDGRVVGELPPTPYTAGWKERLLQLATVRYLYYRQRVRPRVLRDAILGRRESRRTNADTVEALDETAVEANVLTGRIARHWADIEAATAYLLDRISEAVSGADSELVLMINGDVQAVYEGRGHETSNALRLNRLAAELAAERDIPFLDLHPVFTADWDVNGERFTFIRDAHWNARGHRVAAEALADLLSHTAGRQECPVTTGSTIPFTGFTPWEGS